VQSGLAFALLIPCVVLSATDLEKREIPNWTSLWIACVGVGKWAWDRDWTLLALNLSLAALLWAGLTYVTGRIYDRREGQEVLGLGDIKLMAAMMVLLGAERVWIAVFLASLGGIIAFLLAQARKQVKDRNLPFGPMLAFATFLVCLGEGFEAIDWFMGR
jgi:prepilin signal peptidase PulO-like enzyme (type II secretory pathway)